jgi:D-3-phosphoglycerate dehydrogenase / 2-oxoglutarate reductase
MASFRVVLIEHGYASTRLEHDVISAAGGELIDAENRPLAEALTLCEDTDAVLFRRIEMTGDRIRRIARSGRCKIILRYGVGTDNVDVQAATEAGIIVGHVPAYCIDEVSTHALALLLACARNVVGAHRKLAQGDWDVTRLESVGRLSGRTLGIVGLGNIGQATARKVAGWGLRVLATDPLVPPAEAAAVGATLVDLDTLCAESDYLSLHCPLLPETRHLINERTLGRMRPGAIVVNTARGPVVKTDALLAALDAGRLAGAGLDVFETEPLPADSPLRRHPRLVLTDHTAWYSEESQRQLQRTAAEEIVRVCTGGLPVSLMNPEVLRRLGRFDGWTPGPTVRWQIQRLRELGCW